MPMIALRNPGVRWQVGGYLLLILLLFGLNLGGIGWVVQETETHHSQLPLLLLGTFSVDILVVGVLFLLLDRQVFEPITQLTAETDAIARGELGQSITVVDTEDELGALTGSIHAMEDLLASKVQEAQQFEQAVEHAGHAIYITDTDGAIEYVNPAFEEITQYREEQAIGKTPEIMSSGQQPESYYQELWETVHSGEVWVDQEIMNQRASGELFYADQTIAPITDTADNVVKFVAIMADRTDQIVSRQQTQVLSRVVRHNLRTELNVIDGYANEILEVDDARTRAEYVHDIRERVEWLVEVSQKVNRAIQEFNRGVYRDAQPVCATTDRAAAGVAEQFPQAEITTDLPSSELEVFGNLSLILEELVENAIEHNDQETPSVTISIGREVAGDPPPMIRVEVIDDGPGIPPVEREVLEEGEESPLFHGSGVGLWTVYWTVTYAGGDISIAERSPRGTRVVVILPRVSVRASLRNQMTDTADGASTMSETNDEFDTHTPPNE